MQIYYFKAMVLNVYISRKVMNATLKEEGRHVLSLI